jgi:capsule polysaccharide export protein KpsE/RkpR
MVESLRQEAVIQQFDSATEIEFPSPETGAESKPRQSATGVPLALYFLWEERGWLFRFAAWSLAISAALSFLIPNRYESSVSLMPPDFMSGSESMLAASAAKASPELAALAGNLLGMKGSGALFVDLFRSRSVQEHIVDRFHLQKIYWSRYKEDARKRLNSNTDVNEDRKSGVITLTVDDRSQQRARDMAQAYVEELNRLLSQVSTSSARRERVFIEGRLARVTSDLEDAEKRFGDFSSKNSTLDIKEQTKAMVESAGVLQGQLIAAQSEMQGLEQIYTNNNVRVRSLRAKVDELKSQLQKLEGTNASLASDSTQSNEMYPPIRKLPLLGVEWADLYRRMKIQETVYELLNQQYELARIQEAKEIPVVSVIDPANLPERKSSPHRLLIIGLVTILAVAGGAAWILGIKRIESLEDADPRRQLALSAAEGWQRLRSRILKIGLVQRSKFAKASGDGLE